MPDSVGRIVEEMRESLDFNRAGPFGAEVEAWADRLSSLPRSPGQHQELLGDESHPDQLGYVATHLSLALDLVRPSGDWWYLVERWADRHKWTDREPTCEVVPASPGQGEAEPSKALVDVVARRLEESVEEGDGEWGYMARQAIAVVLAAHGIRSGTTAPSPEEKA